MGHDDKTILRDYSRHLDDPANKDLYDLVETVDEHAHCGSRDCPVVHKRDLYSDESDRHVELACTVRNSVLWARSLSDSRFRRESMPIGTVPFARRVQSAIVHLLLGHSSAVSTVISRVVPGELTADRAPMPRGCGDLGVAKPFLQSHRSVATDTLRRSQDARIAAAVALPGYFVRRFPRMIMRMKSSAGGAASAGGSRYEARVGAWYCVYMLAEGNASTVPWAALGAVPTYVGAQTGEAVDDLLVGFSDGGYHFIQTKTRLDLQQGETSALAAALDQCVRQFLQCQRGQHRRPWDRPLDRTRDRLLIVVGDKSSEALRKDAGTVLGRMRELETGQPLEDAAVNQRQDEVLQVMLGHVRRSWKAATTRVPSHSQLKGFFDNLAIEELAVHHGGRSEREACTLLRLTSLEDPKQDLQAWTCLLDLVGQAAEDRTGVDRAALVRYLETRGVRLRHMPRQAADLEGIATKSFGTRLYSVASYPRTLPGGEELRRPELDALLERISEKDFSTTVLLGERGSGKSALLAALDAKLRSADVAILSIKADMLGTDVRDPATLDAALGMPLGLELTAKMVARNRTAVILMDQLDALADVLDRRTERLNVLLDVIRSLSGTKNLHLVISSRPFEYQHDVRLRSIDADRLDLELPPWTEVVPVLATHGYTTASIAEPVQELLRNPWTLNQFLRLKPKDVDFTSLFSLLEDVWATTVKAPEAPAGTTAFVDTMVRVMSQEETLWVPRAIVSVSDVTAQRYLLEQDIIQFDQVRMQLAFRHQSFFEFALVRRFATGGSDLSAFVMERSEGLFIRPVALAGLAYLRAAAPSRYEHQLRTLWNAKPRAHLRALILDFVAAQAPPVQTEVAIVSGLLADENEGAVALAAVGPYPAWFDVLVRAGSFKSWLRRDPQEAIHVTALLARAASESPENVLDLVEREWLGNPDYDRLSFSVLYSIRRWSERGLSLLLRIVRRSANRGIYDLALQMIESNPYFAARLLRQELDRRLGELLAEGKRWLAVRPGIEQLLDEDEHTGVFGDLAETCPHAFIESLLPWIVEMLEATSDEKERYQQYRQSSISVTPFEFKPAASLFEATQTALERLAEDSDAVLAQVAPYLQSDNQAVHALLTLVMRGVSAARPLVVRDYLLEDPRRLGIGDFVRSHTLSRLVLEAVLPFLSQEEAAPLEAAILSYDYYIAPDDDLSEEQRTSKAKWNREHRLFLLQSFPDSRLSAEGLRTKRDLEEEFPNLDEAELGKVTVGEVRAPHELADLEAMSDDEIVAVFDELTDDTEWNHPQRWRDGDRLIGGSIQQSRVVGELAATNPERAIRLIHRFRPRDQERPTAEAIEGLAKTGIDPQQQIELIRRLAARGFSSEEFITAAANVLQVLSEKLSGLSDSVMDLLLKWLAALESPTAEEFSEPDKADIAHPVLFGLGGFFVQAHGRGPVIEAVASGYLKRHPPDIAKWADVVQRRLPLERHSGVWVSTLRHFEHVLNKDPVLGTSLLSQIFDRHPEVLRELPTCRIVANCMRGFSPSDAVLHWIDLLFTFADARSQQAAGELLYLYVMRNPESCDRVESVLRDDDARHAVRGLAYGATYCWQTVSTRPLGAKVFLEEIRRWPGDAAKTLSSLLVVNQGDLDLDEPTKEVLRTAATNGEVLVDIFSELSEELEASTLQEPGFVAEISKAFVTVATRHQGESLAPIYRGRTPEVLTGIALALHRTPGFAEAGLDLFESLLHANVSEARGAAELLDRKPNRRFTSHSRRPRRPRGFRRRR